MPVTYPGGGQGGGWNDQSGWGQQQGGGDHPSGGYPTGGYPTGGYPQQGGDHPSGNYPTGGYPQQGGGYPPTGGFPQQVGYPQAGGGYGGLGVYGGFDQEPPKKSKKTLWLVLGVVVLVLLVGGGITAYLLTNKKKDDSAALTDPSTAPPSSTSQQANADPNCPKTAGMRCVQTSLGFTYEVPKDWTQVDDRIPVAGFPNVALSGVTSYGDYECEAKSYTKGTNGGALLDKGDINDVATRFAQAVATQYYSSGGAPQVTLTAPKAVKIPHTQKDGQKVVIEGVQVDANVTQTANKCLASKGIVKVLLLDGSSKYHALVVNGDLEGGGGGDKPPLPKEADLQKVIDSLRSTS